MEELENKTAIFNENPDSEIITRCDICGTELYTGDVVYKVLEENWCEDCIEDLKKIL